jgi:hypothetical protein
VNGKEAFVYESAVAPFVHFSFSGRVRLKVALKSGVAFPADLQYQAWGETIRPQPYQAPIRELDIRPKRLGLKPTVSGGEIIFELGAPANLSIEVNRNLSRPLLVFAAPLETAPPTQGGPNVRYFGPGKIYDAGHCRNTNL